MIYPRERPKNRLVAAPIRNTHTARKTPAALAIPSGEAHDSIGQQALHDLQRRSENDETDTDTKFGPRP